ncbi:MULTISPECIES: hypothetical protein [Sphingobacterium]|uniref:hypothetical protein n=1 Tax=Sphingobacterium TaxID=28453 RepID=UPI000B490BCA|nr:MULTISPECIES: hypothetical protein [Sphingobacterium]
MAGVLVPCDPRLSRRGFQRSSVRLRRVGRESWNKINRDAGTAIKCKAKQRAGRAKAVPLRNRLWIGKINGDEKSTNSERNNQTTWPTFRASVPILIDEAVWAVCPSV